MRAVRLRRRRAAPLCMRSHSRAQAFVEFALAAPFVLLLVVGAGQVGAIAYGMVSADTAAREGGREGSLHPLGSLQTAQANGGTYTCNYATDSQPSGNPICLAVYRAAGLLDAKSFHITITTNVVLFSGSPPFGLVEPPSDVVRVANPNPCGSDAEVDGQISFNPQPASVQNVTVTANGQGTQASATIVPQSTTYRLCLAVFSGPQTINAVMGPAGCGGYLGQTTVNIDNNKHTYTPNPIVLTPNACPTPTPSPSATPSPSPTASPTALPSGTPIPTDSPPPAFTCNPSAATSTGYFTVTVDYPVPIFVPLLGALLGDPGSSTQRTVHVSVTERIDPCAITGNQ